MNDFEANQDYINVVQMLVDGLKLGKDKFEVRIYKPEGELSEQFLHAKCYIVYGQKTDDHNRTTNLAYGIIGSSNFTGNGLQGNSELNVLEIDANNITTITDTQGNKTHLQWFNEKWEDAVDWKEQFLLQVKGSKMAAKIVVPEPEKEIPQDTPLTPYELYIKYLQTQFGDVADASVRSQLVSYLPDGYKTIDYQMDAVEQCFQILRLHGGFFLSDVVGLGKTIVGLLVIKKFIAEASMYHRDPKVLIIVPPAIRYAWEETIDKFDEGSNFKIRDSITIITSGSIDSISEADGEEVESEEFDEELTTDNYGMILIDESHNFRNSETRKYKALEDLIANITVHGEQPFIGLLSATPQNNSPKDLKNQIYLFELEPNRSSFTDIEGGKLDSFFAEKERIFASLRNEDSEEAREKLKALSEDIRKKVLDHIVVRRTRTDIAKHYREDADRLKFPTLKGPWKLDYKMDALLSQLFFDTITAILPKKDNEPEGMEHIGYYRYQAIQFFKDSQKKKLYEKRNLTVEGITRRLSKIMQILLVKRLESSFAAFTESLNNLAQYTRNMLEMFKENQVFICPDIDVNATFAKFDYDFSKVAAHLHKEIARKQRNNRCFTADDFKPEYVESLKQDLAIIETFCKRWLSNRFDPKMNAFMNAMQTRLFDTAINNPHGIDKQRLVIFTEAKATQVEIVRFAESLGHRVLAIDASNRKDKQKVIKENFDALSDVLKDDYDIIVTTEVLAEGVNLHRSNVILNYDAPWNATRLMQRIGRVNRIGSKEDEVHVFNFFPSPEGNKYIKLVQKAYAKLQAFHTMFGEDSKVYSEMEELSEQEFNHDFEGEESPFSQYISDLKAYRDANPQRYEFIKNLEVVQLGGQFTDTDGQHHFIVKTENRAGTPIIIDSNGTAKVVSPLGFMEALKSASSKTFTTEVDEALFGEVRGKAFDAYNTHVTHVISAHDVDGKIRETLKVIKRINEKITSQEARKALKEARRAVENGNSLVMKLITKCAEDYLGQQQSLFSEEENIDLYVSSMFGHLAEKAKEKYGEPFVAMYEL